MDAESTDLDYMGLEHIESWTGKRIEDESAASEGTASRFAKNDVLFGKLRPYLAKVYLAEQEGIATTEALILTSEAVLEPAFLKYSLLSPAFIDAVAGASFGAKMPRANWETIGGLPILFPPKPEQQKIAAFLDWKTSQIDALIAKKQTLLQKLKEKRLAVITQAVTKGLNPDAPLRDSGSDWIGKVPSHWDVLKIKFVTELASGHTPSRTVEEYWIDCNIPWVSLNDSKMLREKDSISETHYQISELGLANSSARLLPAGVVVFSRDATVGLCAITEVPMAVSQHFVAYICGEKISGKYLLFVLKAMNQHLQSLQTGSTIVTIGMPEVRGLICPLPTKAEQADIVDHINSVTAQIDQMLANTEIAINRLTEYRSALITAATTGKIDVRNVAIPAHA
jgi:type I restriction enzyme, S subunit